MKAMLATALLLMALLVSACGGTATATSLTATVSSPPTASPTASPTPDPSVAAVLRVFGAAGLAFDQAVRAMNPEDPRIPATATGAQLIHELTTLHQWKIAGITAKGDLPKVLTSHVVSMTASTAEVAGCVYDPGVLIYATTGQLVPTNTGGQFYVDEHVTLTIVDGVWKVSDSTTQTESSGCLAGY